jgi:hypothetical protein
MHNVCHEILNVKSEGWLLLAHTCNPSYSGGRDQEDHSSKPAQVNNLWDSRKYPTQNRAGGVDQVVECLPRKCEALSSHPSTTKKQNKTKPKNIKPEDKESFNSAWILFLNCY